MEAVERPRLLVLSRDDCHLCHEMIDALRDLQASRSFVLETREIDGDPELMQRHRLRVPVLLGGETELCHGRLDMARVNAWLVKFG